VSLKPEPRHQYKQDNRANQPERWMHVLKMKIGVASETISVTIACDGKHGASFRRDGGATFRAA
jgi:hypothetical protein